MYLTFFNWNKFESKLETKAEKIAGLLADEVDRGKAVTAEWLSKKLPKKDRESKILKLLMSPTWYTAKNKSKHEVYDHLMMTMFSSSKIRKEFDARISEEGYIDTISVQVTSFSMPRRTIFNPFLEEETEVAGKKCFADEAGIELSSFPYLTSRRYRSSVPERDQYLKDLELNYELAIHSPTDLSLMTSECEELIPAIKKKRKPGIAKEFAEGFLQPVSKVAHETSGLYLVGEDYY